MLKKKLETVELNKKEQKIILEEKQSPWISFWKKYGKLIFLTSLIVSLTILIVSIFITVSNLNTSDKPIIKEVSIDTDLTDANISVDTYIPLTLETAKNLFNKNSIFKTAGEILVVKTIDTGKYTIKFFSDYTAIKYMKTGNNSITRIAALDEHTYGIKENGVIDSKAEVSYISKTNTKKYSWGTIYYYSDGSAEVVDSKFDIYVRNAKDIQENYISNNKVSYLKETKNIKGTKLNYYYDGTIEIKKGNQSYIVRNENDLNITDKDVTFKNDNQAKIKESIKLKNGQKIDYYTDGGAIITDGSKTLSVRKSNSIIIKDNKIFEIVDNIYVTVSKTENNGNVIYYTNGSAVIQDYNGNKVYVEENSDIKYKNNQITDIGNNYENLAEERNVGTDKISKFEKTAVIKTDEYIAIVPKDSIIYDTDGSLKEIVTDNIDSNDKPITLTNNTNEAIKYRVVIEKSNRTNLDVQYIRYQLSVGSTYVEPKRLDSVIWTDDGISDVLSVTGTNYILLDKTLEAHAKDEIKIMLWTDYETIPNSMQDKYFYGTLKIYAWKEIKK